MPDPARLTDYPWEPLTERQLRSRTLGTTTADYEAVVQTALHYLARLAAVEKERDGLREALEEIAGQQVPGTATRAVQVAREVLASLDRQKEKSDV